MYIWVALNALGELGKGERCGRGMWEREKQEWKEGGKEKEREREDLRRGRNVEDLWGSCKGKPGIDMIIFLKNNEKIKIFEQQNHESPEHFSSCQTRTMCPEVRTFNALSAHPSLNSTSPVPSYWVPMPQLPLPRGQSHIRSSSDSFLSVSSPLFPFRQLPMLEHPFYPS